MATSKAYLAAPETPITFLASGGTVVHTLTSLATLSGRQSAGHDFGASARAYIFEWRAWVKMATTPVVSETIDWYYKTNDATHYDNDDGTGDAALSAADKLKNLHYIGSITIDEASSTPEFSASGVISIYQRYIQIVAYNSTADALSATAGDHGFELTPLSIQGQAT